MQILLPQAINNSFNKIQSDEVINNESLKIISMFRKEWKKLLLYGPYNMAHSIIWVPSLDFANRHEKGK